MKKYTRWVGLDVHAETIAVGVAEADGTVQALGIIPNRPESLAKLMRKIGAPAQLQVCYEAGPCGYTIYWQLAKLGIACVVVAPTLIPTKPGDRVKTDRRDAAKLARLHRSGELTAVWVPDAEHEALRDLVRAREAAKKDQLRARHRLSKLLLRRGIRRPANGRVWGSAHMQWLQGLRFEQHALQHTLVDYLTEVQHVAQRVDRLDQAIDEAVEVASPSLRAVIEALQTMRGVAKTTAVTLVTEIGSFSRFDRPAQLMSYAGMVPSEASSGNKTRRGSITKTGNAHLRRVLAEAAWSYRFRPAVYPGLRKRQEGQSQDVVDIAWKAQHRLNRRYRTLAARGKAQPQVATAVGRELLGFIWAIATRVEQSLAA